MKTEKIIMASQHKSEGRSSIKYKKNGRVDWRTARKRIKMNLRVSIDMREDGNELFLY
jgi:hypothetical protein